MACVAGVHRCPHQRLPVQLTLIGTLVSRFGGEAEERVGAEMHTLLSPEHQLPRSGPEPIILHGGSSPLPASQESCAPALPTVTSTIMAQGNNGKGREGGRCTEMKRRFLLVFERRQCTAAVERDGEAVGRVRAREEGVFMLQVPRGCCKADPGTKALVLKAGESEDWPHGLERDLRGF